MDILSINGLSHSYGLKQVLNGVSLTVPERSVFGFMGRNGAGKTTTMKAVLGLLQPSAGQITVCGETVRYGGAAANRYIGYLPDVPAFYPYMRALEYMKLCGAVSGMSGADTQKRSEELLSLVGLSREKNEHIRGFSRGMRQRLGIAQALLHGPKLLICDEPTSALDPAGRKEILDLLTEVRERTTVLFSTHILSDVERVCDRAAVLHDGKVVLEGSLSEIKSKRRADGYAVTLSHPASREMLWKSVSAELPEARLQTEGDTVTVCFDDLHQGGVRLMNLLARTSLIPERFELREPTLESLFLEVIGQ